MPDKAEAIATLEDRHRRFRDSIHELPETAYKDTWLGSWSLDHLLAHMAGWFREITPGFERVGRGERPVPEGVDYSNADSWNAKFAAQPKGGRAALADWDAAYAAYLAAAQALPEDKFGDDPQSGRPRIGNRLLQGSGIGHLEEHQPQLDEWLKKRG